MDGMWFRRSVCVVLGVVLAPACSVSAEDAPRQHKLVPALKLAKSSLASVNRAKDYTAVFYKREMVGSQVFAHTMNLKVRHEPFSVYLQFHKPHEGREVIYVAGRNQGQLLAHETGLAALVGTVALDPNSQQALQESRYPITDIGMKTLVERIIAQWEFESQYGECEVKYYPDAKLGKGPDQVACKVIESSHPKPRKQFKFHMTRLYIEKKTNLPIRVEQYGFPASGSNQPPLVEEYTYSKIQLDAGLSDIHFDARNPSYGF